MITRLTLLALFAILVSSCAKTNSDVTVIRLAHTLDIAHPVHFAMVRLKERLEELSGGSIAVELYGSGQLGSERELLELLQIGSLSMTKVSASSLESFVPEMAVFSVPYLFSSEKHLRKTLESDLGQRLLEAGKPYYFLGLGYYDAGSRSFYTTQKPVYTPDDLRGMKIRVLNSQSAVAMVNTMGGAATPVSWGELYTALQQGVVDGAENNPPSFYLSKHYEVAKYYLLDEHTSIPDVLVFGTHAWNKLNQQQRDWLRQAAAESITYQQELWKESTAKALEAVKAAGVQVVEADKRAFAEKTRVLREQYKGTPIGELISEIESLDTANE